MYVQVGDFRASRGPTTVPLTQISCNMVFSKYQNARKEVQIVVVSKNTAEGQGDGL